MSRRWIPGVALLIAALIAWRHSRSDAPRVKNDEALLAAAPANAGIAPPRLPAEVAVAPAPASVVRQPVAPGPAERVAAVEDRSFAPLPAQDDHVDPDYQTRQRGRIVALGRRELPALEARSEALERAGDEVRSAELRFRAARLRAHLARVEAQGNEASP